MRCALISSVTELSMLLSTLLLMAIWDLEDMGIMVYDCKIPVIMYTCV